MKYVILDPGHSYPARMMEFLNRCGLKAIAIFTREDQYHIFHDMHEHLQNCMVDEYLITQFSNIEAMAAKILEDHDKNEIEGIIPWAEFTIEFGAKLGELLGLDWNSSEVIHRFRNKFALKDYLRHHSEVRINASRIVDNEKETREFQESVGKWPIVVKPTEGAGSRNVFFADNMDDLISRCVQVFENEGGEVLLEEYVGGHEFVVNGITDAERNILVTDIWRYDKRESHGYKNLYYETIKVDRSSPVFNILMMYAGHVIEDLGLRKAPFHMELKLDDEGACLIEVGARFAGGNQPLVASRLHYRSLFELAACHYVGNLPLTIEDVHYDIYDSQQARLVNGIQSVEIPEIKQVHGVEAVQSLPSFFMIGFVKQPGSYLPVTKDHYGKSYEIYLVHPDSEQIAYDAARVRELIWYE